MNEAYSTGSLPATGDRPRKGVGTIVLLSLLSLSNALVLVLGVAAWLDAIDHGDDSANILAIATILTVIAIVGIGGAWFTRKWGPRLYVAVSATSLVLGLVIAPESISAFSLVGIALAVILWLIAEMNW